MPPSFMHRIPPSTLHDITNYVEKRYRPGSFLFAVMSNNLEVACMQADDDNAEALRYIVEYVYNWTPDLCHGSQEKVIAWIERTEGREP